MFRSQRNHLARSQGEVSRDRRVIWAVAGLVAFVLLVVGLSLPSLQKDLARPSGMEAASTTQSALAKTVNDTMGGQPVPPKDIKVVYQKDGWLVGTFTVSDGDITAVFRETGGKYETVIAGQNLIKQNMSPAGVPEDVQAQVLRLNTSGG